MLGQTLYDYDTFVRNDPSEAGGSQLSTPSADEILQASLQHVVVNYDPINGRQIFVNGELIDVVVTERGICINPRRADLIEATRGSGLPILPIRELKAQVERLCGGAPSKPELGDKVVAAIKWVDGTVIDCVRQVG